MRRRRTFLILLLALASGGLAGYSALKILENRDQIGFEPPPPPSGQQVMVAATDMGVGDVFAEEDVRVINWPGDEPLPEGVMTTRADVVGRGAITPIKMNEMLLNAKLGTRGGDPGMAIQIPEGMRGYSIRTNPVVAVAGWAQPNTRVDIILQMDPVGGGQTLSQTIMQNVELLGADAFTERDPQGNPINYGIATFLLSPEDAEKLFLAASKGDITFTLRNSMDTREVSTRGTRTNQLFPGGGGGAPRAVASSGSTTVPEPTVRTMTVWDANGNKTIIRY